MLMLCYPDPLPSPEMELLNKARLEHHLDPVWIPHLTDIPKAIKIITNANNIDEIRKVIDPYHYRNLKDIDGRSFQKLIGLLKNMDKPITSDNEEKLINWFWHLADFFFLVRPSNKRIRFDSLNDEEKRRFGATFINGAGQLFFSHCKMVVRKTLNEKRTIYPNDLYDMMQLVLLQDYNRFFVTDEKSFFLYKNNPEIQRVMPWSIFRSSG